jgi:DNA-binding IclR family transcriptional regulator
MYHIVEQCSILWYLCMKSLHKVLDVIDAIGSTGSVGIRELSGWLGFPPATTHRIVATLMERRYVKQDPETKKYSLSVKFLELGSRVQEQFDLTSAARPHILKLMSESMESVNVAVRDEDEVVYLDHVRSSHSMLQLFTKVGARAPLYCTGVGKMFLSQWDASEVDAYLQRTRREKFTDHTLVTEKEIQNALSLIRKRGYATDDEEMEKGVQCVAAIIRDYRNGPVGAISISGAATRMTKEKISSLGKMVYDCANVVSRDMGWTP